MTRKEYVLAVTGDLQANPRVVLSGHSLPAVVLKEIANRPDVISKLAAFNFMTTNFAKGSKGLKKSANFKISGYKNFNEFNAKARIDIENFVEGLSPQDAEEFTNSDNVACILLLADTPTGDLETDIATGKSKPVKFDTAVKKENKMGNGMYVTIMFGNSLIRGVEQAKAEAKAAQNAKKVAVKQANASKIKSAFVAKAKAKAARLAADGAALAAKASGLEAGLNQFAAIGVEFGAKSANPRDVVAAINRYTRETKAFLKNLTPAEKVVYTEVLRALKKGDNKGAQAMLKSLGNEKLTEIVNNGNLTTADAKLDVRKAAIKKQIKALIARNEAKLVALEAATTPRAKAQIRFDMKAIAKKINDLKAALGIYKDLTPAAIKNKKDLFKATNAMIAANIEKGATVKDALAAAVAKIPASEQVKEQIKQQIMQDIANQTPVIYAVQQALQDIPTADLQLETFEDELPVDEIDELEFQQGLVDVFGTEGAIDGASLAGTASTKSILDMI